MLCFGVRNVICVWEMRYLGNKGVFVLRGMTVVTTRVTVVTWIVSPLKIHVHPKLQNVNLIWKQDLYRWNWLRILKRNHPGLRVGPQPNNRCPYKKRRHTETEKTPCEDRAAETGLMLPRAKEHGEPERQGRIFPRSFQRKLGPANTSISDFLPPELWESKLLF